MAYQMKNPGGFRRPYNINSAVGFNAANRNDDVMLVQFLLRLWGGEHYGPPTGRTRDDPPPTGPVEAMLPIRHFFKGMGPMLQDVLPAVDGNCDGVTKTWIMMFQMYNKRILTTIDGRVDPIPNQPDPRTNTMLLLNISMWQQDYLDLPANAPAPLIRATQTVR